MSRATVVMVALIGCPTCSPRAIRSSASGNWLTMSLRRLSRILRTTIAGKPIPIAAPAKMASAGPVLGASTTLKNAAIASPKAMNAIGLIVRPACRRSCGKVPSTGMLERCHGLASGFSRPRISGGVAPDAIRRIRRLRASDTASRRESSCQRPSKISRTPRKIPAYRISPGPNSGRSIMTWASL